MVTIYKDKICKICNSLFKPLSGRSMYCGSHKIELKKIHEKRYRDKRYYSLNRETVLLRDNYKCTRCSSTDNLIVHHIDHSGGKAKTRINEQINNNPENLVTLCKSCHNKVHIYEVTTGRMNSTFYGLGGLF